MAFDRYFTRFSDGNSFIHTILRSVQTIGAEISLRSNVRDNDTVMTYVLNNSGNASIGVAKVRN